MRWKGGKEVFKEEDCEWGKGDACWSTLPTCAKEESHTLTTQKLRTIALVYLNINELMASALSFSPVAYWPTRFAGSKLVLCIHSLVKCVEVPPHANFNIIAACSHA